MSSRYALVHPVIRAFPSGDLELNINQTLTEELHKLIASYRAGTSNLAYLSQRIETLIEAMRSNLSADTFSRAINSVYLIEEINALVLDESRRTTDIEQHDIHTQLEKIEYLFATN